MPNRSIQQHFLFPVLAAVVGSMLLASVVNVVWSHRTWRAQEAERLASIMSTLASPSFPLPATVLERMSQLAQSEFMTLDADGELLAASYQPTADELSQIVKRIRSGDLRTIERDGLELSDQTSLGRVVELPARRADGAKYLLAISHRNVVGEQTVSVVLPPLVIGLVTCAAILVLVRLSAARLVRPIEQLADHAARLSAGDFRPAQVSTDCRELFALGQTMNELVAKLLELMEQARRRERLQALDQLSGSIAHQLRNAATGARLALDLSRREHPGNDDPSLQVADDQLRFIESCCQRFLGAAKRDPKELTWKASATISLAAVATEALSRVHPLALHSGVTVDSQLTVSDTTLSGDDEALRQVVENLLINAIEAVRRPEIVEKHIRVELAVHDALAVLNVGDTGAGPSPALAAALFEPLVTDKPSGTGLGLALVREIVHTHGGAVTWRRETNWTWFEIRLPLAAHEVSDVEMAHSR
ncbi:MAG: HAMP domain-containing histidine kinase [Planctomycetaceae bacterium]|nr:HAMP domain-containing histidine kinase [Planctomycetaceae bacterium]